MADTSAEKLQNMNIQDFDGSEFDPFSPQNKVANMNKGEQAVDLLGGFVENGQMTNGSDKHVSFDQEAGIGLPDPSYLNQGQGQIPGFEGQKGQGLQRNMSEGEILGYQNEYGESIMTGQVEYMGDSDEENREDIQGTDLDTYQQGQGRLPGGNAGEHSSPDPSQNLHEQYVENDYAGDNEAGVPVIEEPFDSPMDYENEETDPDSWRPQMDPERLRRSLSPERSVSPCVKSENFGDVDSDMVSSPSEMSQPEPMGNSSERDSSIPKSEGVETPDLVSQGSQLMSEEETESLDSRSETDSTPRRRRIPKPKTKKPLELPPWNDNVVIPKPPRMKPTLIGKQADLPPPSPPRFHRPYTAPARHNAKDGSSDSGVEEESTRRSSGDMKKKYGIDTKNTGYRPGGGNVQVFSQKIDTKSITPRTDTTKPKSALSPRMSPSKERSPAIPKAPTPNTKNVHSKIGSLNNVKHAPGGGNVRVLNAKVDFSTVQSKVGSKDKIDHKPKGGDKKIETQKLTWQTDSRVGSLKNVTHAPGGGNVKDGISEVLGIMNTRENIRFQPGGGNIPDPYEEDLDWDVDAKVNTLDNLGYEPGGGCVKIFSEKLNWKAEPKVDTGLHRRNEDISIQPDSQRYDSSKQQVAITIEPVPERFNHTYLEPVPEVEYQSAADVKRNQSHTEPIKGSFVGSGPITNGVRDQIDGSQTVNDKTGQASDLEWKQGPPPPPKPPRCIHKQWELERTDDSGDIDKQDEREILTFTKEELDEILRKKDLDDCLEGDCNEPVENHLKYFDEQNIDNDKINEDDSAIKINGKLQIDMPISDITNEEELKNVSVDHKEETFILERKVIEKIRGKENENISKKAQSKKKSGFVNKMKSLFSAKSKEAKDDKKGKRFSSTSYDINRSNSNSSRISIKGKKLKDFANEEEKEIELMVKYLGYHSPKLARNIVIEQDTESKDRKSKHEKKKQLLKKKTFEKVEQVEKLANLGYRSPKVAERKGKPVIMTGSPTQKRKTEMEVIGVIGETVKQFDDENGRVDRLSRETVRRIHVKEGIHSDYQDIDFGANVSNIKNGNDFDHANNTGLLLEEVFEKPSTGIMNEGYEYDDVASDEDTDDLSGNKSDEYSEDERHTSVAEINVKSNRGSKKEIQTTTFKYKMDQRPTSPLNEIKQKMIGSLDHSFPSVGDRTDVEREMNILQEDFTRTAHDKFGYAIVQKMEESTLFEHKKNLGKTIGNKERDKAKTKESFDYQKRSFENGGSNVITKDALRESKGKIQMKSKPALEESEHELTLEEELRTVLSNIQDNESSFLKSPRRREGTETGSRPGTPKIPIKPLWMKAEQEGKGLDLNGRCGLRRYMSDENLSRPSLQTFFRSNRTQSMMVRKNGQSDSGSLFGSDAMQSQRGAAIMQPGNGSAPLLSGSGSHLARSIKVINLCGTEEIMSSRSVDDLRDNGLTRMGGNSSTHLTCRDEGMVSEPLEIFGIGESRDVTSSENCGMLKFDKCGRSFLAGISDSTDLKTCYIFDKENVNRKPAVDNNGGQSTNSNTDEITNLVLNQRLSWSAKSRVGSLDNATHSPGGGNVKILDQKVEVKAQSKIGSTANLKHKPGGGDKKIETQKLEFKDSARSKVGSMDKVKHKPGGGDIRIFTETPKWETSSRVKSLENAQHVPGGGSVEIVDEKPVWMASSKVESLVNADHIPGGGKVKVTQHARLNWQTQSKVRSMRKVSHKPGGGNVHILDEKVDFTQTAKPKVGSMDKVKHQPGGGDKKIETQKLNFKETAKARTDTGASTGERQSSNDPQRSGSVTSSQDGSV